MEKAGGYSMVTGNLARKLQPEKIDIIDPLAPDPLKYTSVALSEIYSNNTRFEASAFNLEAKAAKYKVAHCQYGYVHLWGKDGLVSEASYPGRFKRIYVEKEDGIPFFLPSQLGEIQPKPSKFISGKTYKSIKGIEIKPNSLLLSRSGTIGKCAISSRTTIGKVYSDDVIRVFFRSDCDLGYVYAYFCTPIGQQMLQTNNYGAVVQHIEPEHLKNIIIPNAPDPTKRKIHNLVVESYDLRDKSNELIDEAEQILYE
jgi:type I restriction enzyme S subunit